MIKKGEVVLEERGILLTERADLMFRASEQVLYIVNVTRMKEELHLR